MKSKITSDRYYLECSCRNPDCMLTFDYDKEWDFISVSFQYNRHIGFFKRLHSALSYLFMKSNLYWVDMTITKEDIEQLDELVQEIKKTKGCF